VQVTIADVDVEHGEETVHLVEEEHAKISYKPNSPSALFIRCDVSKTDELAAAFARHQEVFGKLDICINNAGIVGGTQPFHESDTWRNVVGINLVALIDGTSKAIEAMRKQGGGLILNVASAAGFFPMSFAPIYSATKGGVVMFTRSLATLGMGIRVNALCPMYVETNILDQLPAATVSFLYKNNGFVPMKKVIDAAFSLLEDESKSGDCAWVQAHEPTESWPDEKTRKIQDGLIGGLKSYHDNHL